MQFLFFALSGCSLAIASLYPETWLSLLAALLSAGFLARALRAPRRRYLGALLCGSCFHLLAFYWVPQTIQTFGGFSGLGAGVVFLLFILSASLQFILVAGIYSLLQSSLLSRYYLVLPLAWMSSEYIFPRLFPWQIGHALIRATPIAGSAEFVGVTVLSGLLVWWSSYLVALLSAGSSPTAAAQGAAPELSGGVRSVLARKGLYGLPLILLTVVAVSLGMYRNSNVAVQLAQSTSLQVALVQGNLSTDKKGDISYMQANIARYRALSREAIAEGAELLFWPESVVNQWLPEEVKQVRTTEYDPAPDLKVPMVYGTLSFAERDPLEFARLQKQLAAYPTVVQELRYEKYNAAVAIDEQGRIIGRYYKRILMPFGEFLPFADTFPSLRQLSPQTGDFSPGKRDQPISYPSSKWSDTAPSLGILICYEDLIPSISADMVEKGANLLVNLTNDAWYGDTAAPHQHHLLAQWRAIESRKYLLRVTNTGKTAVVNPFGRTQSTLEGFTEDYLLDEIKLLSGSTFYSRYGDRVLGLLLLVLWIIAAASAQVVRRGGKAAKTP